MQSSTAVDADLAIISVVMTPRYLSKCKSHKIPDVKNKMLTFVVGPNSGPAGTAPFQARIRTGAASGDWDLKECRVDQNLQTPELLAGP